MGKVNSYKAKGYLWFVMTSDGYGIIKETREDVIKERTEHIRDKDVCNTIIEIVDDELTKKNCDIMTGEEFLSYVNSGGITNYDGNISEVYVDGMISNLGLCHESIMQGEFLVDDKMWEELCEKHKIEVDWALNS